MKASKLFWSILIPMLLFRIFLIFHVGLIDDEAYHWTWAKNINYSYFDHPGMVGWIIWPFIKLFGDVEWAIRLPGFFMYLGIIYTVFKLGEELFSKAVGEISALLLLFIPLWGFASLGTLPDMPLALFWIIIVRIFWQSVRPTDKTWAKNWSVKKTWLLIGFVMGLGMNSKLTVCLLGLGMGLYLMLTPRVRHHLRSPWPYVGALITFAMMTPVFYWNSQHEWASFHYQFLSRHQEAHGIDFNRWLQFWSYQWLFMSPGIYFLMLIVLFAGLKKGFLKKTFDEMDERWRLLFCLPIPSLLLFYYQPLMSAYKPHWSGPSYMILLFGVAKILADGLQFSGQFFIQKKSKLAWISVAAFLFPFQLVYIPMLTPVLPQVYAYLKSPVPWQPSWDFSNEFYGWKELGTEVQKKRGQLQQMTGRPINLGAQRYELIAQFTWGAKDKVWQLCRERDQYFYDQPQADKEKLYGSDFIIVNNDKYPRNPMEAANFEACEKYNFPVYRSVHAVQGDSKILARTFYIYFCKNFSGLK